MSVCAVRKPASDRLILSKSGRVVGFKNPLKLLIRRKLKKHVTNNKQSEFFGIINIFDPK